MLTTQQCKSIVIGICSYIGENGGCVIIGRKDKSLLKFEARVKEKRAVTIPLIHRYGIDDSPSSPTLEGKVIQMGGVQKVTFEDLGNTINEVEESITKAVKKNGGKIPKVLKSGFKLGGMKCYPFIEDKKLFFQYEFTQSMRQILKNDMKF